MANSERTQNYRMENGALRCAAADAIRFYREDPARVLTLFTAAAAANCPVEADTYLAAAAAIPAIRALPAAVVRGALQNILLSDAPQALAPLLAEGGLAAFGLSGCTPCLHSLSDVPCTMEARWWVFLRLCGAQYALVCQKLGLSEDFAATLSALDRLAVVKTLPANVQELKHLLAHLPELDYESAARTLQNSDPRWAGQVELYDRLRASGEPYLRRHLALSRADLAVQGITGKKAERVLYALLDAVIKAPELNHPAALEPLAVALSVQYR